MTPPEGYSVEPGLVCKLERSIYGLKQASRQWNAELTLKLIDFGFQQSAHDHCLFTKDASDGFMALLVYVDDILVTAPNMVLIQAVKDYLHSLFTIKDLGHARSSYVWKLLEIPMVWLKLSANCGTLLPDPGKYRRLVGRLLYLGFIRPDISYSVQQLSQFLTRPCEAHWKTTVHVVRYLKGTPTKGLFLPSKSSFELRAYCDAD
ncbi:Retrovirus-related Pol polyprotein from transposon RE2 [Sesamum angolense]|uniref:Retrovirus-related Pol polyprotein from transposon RE2 n=1 Tax=Sesamum angolense TaxID=2727404 RepID=A0AAE1VTB3_9LAMI|nr:Retrovirus-related Pol polyprotein from transposon RE2 [Sesamum angolense]